MTPEMQRRIEAARNTTPDIGMVSGLAIFDARFFGAALNVLTDEQAARILRTLEMLDVRYTLKAATMHPDTVEQEASRTQAALLRTRVGN